MTLSGPPLIVHFSPLAVIGGCEINCLRLIEGLPNFRHIVVVFGDTGPMSEKWSSCGANVIHLSAWDRGQKHFASALRAWICRQAKPKGVYCWSTSRLPAVLNALKYWNCPVAVYLGNPVAVGLLIYGRLFWRELWGRPNGRTVLVACSKHVAASHRSIFYFRRFPIRVIYNAVTAAFDSKHRYRFLDQGSAPKIGMVARLDRIKDHSTLIRALARCTSVRPDIVVEFAGDGALRQLLELEVILLGLEHRVHFLGFRDVKPLLAEWDIYVHSTTAREGMGTAVAEAMMAGLPCIVTDLPVMREVCGADGAAYTPAGDAAALGDLILALVKNRSQRESLGLAAQKEARLKFELSAVARSYEGLVEDSAGSPVLSVERMSDDR